MNTTNTFLNYAVGVGTYVGIAAAILSRNPGLAQQAEIYTNAALRGVRFATRRTVNLNSNVSTQVHNTNSNLDTVA